MQNLSSVSPKVCLLGYKTLGYSSTENYKLFET